MGNILSQIQGQQQPQQAPANYPYNGPAGPAGISFGRGTVDPSFIASGINSLAMPGMVTGEAAPVASAFDRESDKALGMIDDLLTKYNDNKAVSDKLSSYAEKLNDIGAMRDAASSPNPDKYVSHYMKTQGLDAKNYTPDMPSSYFKEFKEFVKGLGHDFDSYNPDKGLE